MSKRKTSPPIRWEPELLARVVADELERRAKAGEPVLSSRYKRAADPLYELAPEDRAQAFLELDLVTAHKLDLDRALIKAVERAVWSDNAVSEIVLSPATTDREAGADLEPRAKAPRLILRVQPSLPGTDQWAPFLAHEIAHVEDMLDPEFGYSGDRRLRGARSSEFAIRDRYHALWCASIDVRLHKAKLMAAEPVERALSLLLASLRLAPTDAEPIRSWLSECRPDHATLLAIAENPSRISDSCPDVVADDVAQQRTSCPLCDFPAFPKCLDGRELPEAVQAEVRADTPSWSPEDGLCSRCKEIYMACVGHELGGTAWA